MILSLKICVDGVGGLITARPENGKPRPVPNAAVPQEIIGTRSDYRDFTKMNRS
jgi:hypothetical protein